MAKSQKPVSSAVSTLAQSLASKSAPAKQTRAPQQVGSRTHTRKPTAPAVAKASPAIGGAIKFSLSTGRPERGGVLFAHTCAFLELAGMLDIENRAPGKGASLIASKVIGSSAINHHTNGMIKDGKAPNFQKTADGYRLTEEGAAHFLNRPATSIEFIDEFKEMMRTGKVGERIAAVLPKGYKVSPV